MNKVPKGTSKQLLTVDSRSFGVGASGSIPFLIQQAGPKATKRFFEFFTANIRNRNTREAYYRALADFFRLVR